MTTNIKLSAQIWTQGRPYNLDSSSFILRSELSTIFVISLC